MMLSVSFGSATSGPLEHAALLARLREGVFWDLWIAGRVVGVVL
jgi:hypothetical protein